MQEGARDTNGAPCQAPPTRCGADYQEPNGDPCPKANKGPHGDPCPAAQRSGLTDKSRLAMPRIIFGLTNPRPTAFRRGFWSGSQTSISDHRHQQPPESTTTGINSHRVKDRRRQNHSDPLMASAASFALRNVGFYYERDATVGARVSEMRGFRALSRDGLEFCKRNILNDEVGSD